MAGSSPNKTLFDRTNLKILISLAGRSTCPRLVVMNIFFIFMVVVDGFTFDLGPEVKLGTIQAYKSRLVPIKLKVTKKKINIAYENIQNLIEFDLRHVGIID